MAVFRREKAAVVGKNFTNEVIIIVLIEGGYGVVQVLFPFSVVGETNDVT